MGSAKDKLQLWFFRELSDEQRLKLFALSDLPVDELSTMSAQRLALNHIVGVIIAQAASK